MRKPDQVADLEADGAEPVVLDLEEAGAGEVTGALRGAGAVVFAAGAGPGSGAARKETSTTGPPVTLLDAARQAGVDRYVMISSMGAGNPPGGDDVFSVYLRAKARADEALMASGLAWTVVRPGRLTDDPPSGRVRLDRHVERGAIPRADVAAVLAAVLDDARSAGHVLEVVGGDEPLAEALDRLVQG